MLNKIRYICQSLQVNVNKVQKKYVSTHLRASILILT